MVPEPVGKVLALDPLVCPHRHHLRGSCLSADLYIVKSGRPCGPSRLVNCTLKPCPMAQESVSPSNQGVPKRFCFHALSGTIPDFSSESSIPVGWPRPNFREYSAILSIPSFNPT